MLIPDSSNFETLINYFSFAAWTFYGATIAALLWLRFSKPDMERPYKVNSLSLPFMEMRNRLSFVELFFIKFEVLFRLELQLLLLSRSSPL